MRTRVRKWGNSLALRIPKAHAAEVGLQQDTPVDVSVEDGRIVVKCRKRRLSLTQLLDKITPENLHGEVSTGKPAGNEEW